MRPTSTPKIEHEDNFFIEIDLLSFWPTKNNFSFIGIDPTIQHVGPALSRPLRERATIFAGLARLSGKHDTVNYGQIITALITILDLIEGDQDSAALTPLLKLFTVFNVFFSCV